MKYKGTSQLNYSLNGITELMSDYNGIELTLKSTEATFELSENIDYRQICENFETAMAQENYECLGSILQHILNCVNVCPKGETDNLFREFNVFSFLLEIVNLCKITLKMPEGEEEAKEAEKALEQFTEEGHDQIFIYYALNIICLVTMKSVLLLKWAMRQGIYQAVSMSYSKYDKINKEYALKLFSILYAHMAHVGEIAFIGSVLTLASEYLSVENHEKYGDTNYSSIISGTISSMLKYKYLNSEKENDMKIRSLILDHIFIIIDNDWRECLNAALMGISYLLSHDFSEIFVSIPLIQRVMDIFLERSSDNAQLTYYSVKALAHIYNRAPPEALEPALNHYLAEIKSKNIQNFVNLLIYPEQLVKQEALHLCYEISGRFPAFFGEGSEKGLFQILLDLVEDEKIDIKIPVCDLMSAAFCVIHPVYFQMLMDYNFLESILQLIEGRIGNVRIFLQGVCCALTKYERTKEILLECDAINIFTNFQPENVEESKYIQDILSYFNG